MTYTPSQASPYHQQAKAMLTLFDREYNAILNAPESGGAKSKSPCALPAMSGSIKLRHAFIWPHFERLLAIAGAGRGKIKSFFDNDIVFVKIRSQPWWPARIAPDATGSFLIGNK